MIHKALILKNHALDLIEGVPSYLTEDILLKYDLN